MDGVSFKYNFAFINLIDACQHIENGGFARPVGADNTDDLPFFNLKADVVDGHETAKALGDAFHF